MTMTETRDEFEGARSNAKAWFESIEEMLAKFDAEHERDDGDSRTAICESVLSVMVRDGWRQPGVPSEDGAEEYEILLTTGGPALRIFGRIGEHGEPESAELQMQDWGTPWTRYPAPEATLLKFAQCFYFGE